MAAATGFPIAGAREAAARRSLQYVITACGLALVVFLAFTRTYWAPLASSSDALHPAIHVHAVLFFTWTLFFVAQTALVAGGRTVWHRELGMIGIALAAAMLFSGMLATIVSLNAGLAGPRPDVARRAAALSFSGMTLFTTFVTLGIASVKAPERHKRFMVLTTFAILQAAVARVIMLFPAITLPQRVHVGAAIVDALLLGVMLHDRRLTGRWHPAYVLGLAFIVAIQVARSAILDTPLWIDFTAWLAALAR